MLIIEIDDGDVKITEDGEYPVYEDKEGALKTVKEFIENNQNK